MNLRPVLAGGVLIALCACENCPDREVSIEATPKALERGTAAIVDLSFPAGALPPESPEEAYATLYGPGGRSDERGRWLRGSGEGAITNVTLAAPDTLAVRIELRAEDPPGPYVLDVTSANLGVCQGPHGSVELSVE
jgi:hypothetical protein